MSGDFELELEKCERILKSFTVEGIETEEEAQIPVTKEVTGDGDGIKKETRVEKVKRKIIRKVR